MRRSLCVHCCTRQFGTFGPELTSSLGTVQNISCGAPAGAGPEPAVRLHPVALPGRPGSWQSPLGSWCAARALPCSQAVCAARQYGCAAQRHRLTQSCSKTWRCREESLELVPEARGSCILLGAAVRALGYKSSVCLLEKRLIRGRLVSLFFHTCL